MASLALGVKFNPTLGGTTDWVYSSAVAGYVGPAATSPAMVDGKIYRYRAESADLSQWEFGYGVYTASTQTLARSTIQLSSTGAKVSFAVPPQVGVTAFPADFLTEIANNNLVGNNSGGAGLPIALTADQAVTLLKTGTAATGMLQTKIISATRILSAGAGNVSYTGVGFKPSGIIALGVINSTSGYNFGFADSARGVGNIATYGANLQTFGSHLIEGFVQDSSTANYAFADVASYDADGFTLTWTNVGSPGGTMNLFFLCLR